MSDLGSVSVWLKKIPTNDQEAFTKLWERYFHKLVSYAKQRLHNRLRIVSDEEDIALSAFNCFYQNAVQGRFPKLDDRDDLWNILVILTKRKLYDHIEHQSAKKRNWQKTVHGLTTPASEGSDKPLLLQIIEEGPTPEFASEMAENFNRLIEALGEEKYQKVAILKLEGYSNAEIAGQIQRMERTVTRRLKSIRKIWLKISDLEIEPNPDESCSY